LLNRLDAILPRSGLVCNNSKQVTLCIHFMLLLDYIA
jgi:hypothetical protein